VVSAPNSNVSRTVTVTLSAPPTIALSANELNFQAIRGSNVPLVKKVKVRNGGNGTLGTITCAPNSAVAWVICQVIPGDSLMFTANPVGLTASPSPDADFLVTAVGAFNNPQHVTVSLTIQQPVLSVSQSVVNLTVTAPATAGPATVMVTNSGAGTLADLGAIGCTAIPAPADPHVGCAVTQATGALAITVNTATAPALPPGQHVFTVQVSATNVSNPQTIVIVVTVN